MTYTTPTYQNPSKQNLRTLLTALKREIMKDINCVKIGTIKAFDAGGAGRAANVNVQIAFTQVVSIDPDGTQTLAQYPLLLNVPVLFPCGGGFTLTFPIAVGDECLVLFNDRQLDSWLQSGAGQPPPMGRLHDLSDGIAIVGVRNDTRALTGISTTTTQLRNDAGTTYIEVAGGGIVNIVAPTSINMTAPIINMNASTEINANTPILNVEGVIDVQNTGSVSTASNINGNIVTNADITTSVIGSLNAHVHSGVTTGGGNTGGPH